MPHLQPGEEGHVSVEFVSPQEPGREGCIASHKLTVEGGSWKNVNLCMWGWMGGVVVLLEGWGWGGWPVPYV